MQNIFNPEYLKGEFHTFGFSHLAALFILIMACIGVVLWLKKIKNDKIELIFCIVVGVLTYGQELTRMIWHAYHGSFSFGEHLPLHLCGLGIILGPIMLIKKNYKLYEYIYFWGFGGAIQALLTPDLVYEFPHFGFLQYFISHSLIIISCVYMTFVVGYRPTWKSIIKVFVVTNIYLVFIIIVNIITTPHFMEILTKAAPFWDRLDELRQISGNYLFICRKPANPSLIDLLGPWPWYILSLEGVSIVSYLLYYSPFFIKDFVDKLKKKEEKTI
ncbi:MAG: TIGR02206 family membrane protein [Spirochaetales bacterium]|nr:TIGR02206 family membrane protein [Spirochaetales bacterium]